MRDAALYGKHPDDRAADGRSRQVLPVSLRPFALDVRRPEVGRRSDRPDHELGAERRRRARVPARARRVVRGARRRVARGSADAPAAGRRRDGPAAEVRAAAAQPEAAAAARSSSRPRCRATARRSRSSRTAACARGQVFIDLWLGDAETGKRTARLVRSTFDPDFEELRLLYSQSAFSPDGQHARGHRPAQAARTCSICSTSQSRKQIKRVRPAARDR